ncbi:MAG: hypothetical protein ACUVV0_11710 [Anaerolineae bacterium]
MRRAIFVLVPLLAITILLAVDLLSPQEGTQTIAVATPTLTKTPTPTESPKMLVSPELSPSPSRPPSVAAFVSTIMPGTVQASPSQAATETSLPLATPSLSPIATETSTPLATPSPIPAATETSTPLATPSPSQAATETSTPLATPSLSPTLISLLKPTATSIPFETPLPGGPFGPLVFSAGITDDHKPLSTGRSFPASTERVYAFFEYRDMKDGTPWSQLWYWNGEQVGDESRLWEWGPDGRSWVFHDILGAGQYELKLYVRGQLVQQGSFYIRRR